MKKCIADNCISSAYAKGYCTKHYQRLRNTGNLALPPKLERCIADECNGIIHGIGYCMKHYMRFRKSGTLEVKTIIRNDKARLLSKVKKEGCWVWTDPLREGYGRFWLKGKLMQAHRASYILLVGEIPPKKQVNHKCHNRSCVNPAHLYIGTQKQNMEDMRKAGREIKFKGEQSPRSKLTIKQVLEIKHRLSYNEECVIIAKDYKEISLSTLYAIKNKITWAHV